MTAPLDFSTVTDAMPAFAFGLASRIGYEAFGVLPAAPSSFAGPAESNSTFCVDRRRSGCYISPQVLNTPS